MAIYHFSAKMISRAKKKNVVASAAYRAGEKLADEKSGKVFDYSRKQNIEVNEILLPEGAPDRWRDRGKLWNDVEMVEKRKDAQLAREFEFSLPIELTSEEKNNLVREFLEKEMVSCGMVVDFALHDKKGNPHIHALCTTRNIKDGKFCEKNRDWNRKDFLISLRKKWEKYANNALKNANIDEKIDCRSHKTRNLEYIPTIHEGYKARNIAKKGGKSQRVEYNKRAKYLNLRLKQAKKEKEKAKENIDNIANKLNKRFDTASKVLKNASKSRLKHPTSQVISEIRDLAAMAEAGIADVDIALQSAAERAGVKDWQRDWQWMTQAEKDEVHLRRVYSDDY